MARAEVHVSQCECHGLFSDVRCLRVADAISAAQHAAPPTPPAPDAVVEALRPVIDKINAVPDDIVNAPVDDSIALVTVTFGEARQIRAALAASRAPGGRA